MKRPMLYWVIMFMLGEVFVKYCSVGWMAILGIVSVGGIRICRQSYVQKNQMLLMSGILFFVLGGISFCYVERQHDICDVENGTSLSFYGKISDIEKKDDTYQYRVATTLLDDNNIRVHILIEQETEFAIGTWIRGNGIVQQFSQSTNPGGFDESAYQFGKGNYLRLTHVEILSIKASVFSIKAYLYRIKNYMIQIYYRLFSETDASLACAMVLGERSNLDADTKLLYQRNGIAHLIAISGLHIAMLGGTIYHLLRKRLGSYPVAAVLGGSFIIMYGVMAGLSGATLRAVVMLIVSIGAEVTGRRYDSMTSVAAALFLMLLQNPYQMNQAGFLLSFGAVIGIAVIQPVWKEWFPQKFHFMEGLFVSLSVQLVLTPVLLYFFYEIPIYGMLLNLIVVPMMSILLFVLILAVLLGAMTSGLGIAAAKGAECIFTIYRLLCKWSEQLPFHTICTGRPPVYWLIIYYVILILFVWAGYQKHKKRQIIWLLCLGSLFGFFYLPGRLTVCMFDVGQGDGIYVRTPERLHILIDGGSSSIKKVGTYVLKNGIKYYGGGSLDYVLVSHSDSDHYSGIVELLEEPTVSIRHFVLPAIENPDDAYLELEKLAKEKGCELLYIQKGDSLQLGSVRFECISPKRQFYEDKNQGSMVLYMKYRQFDMLFTGDMDETVEREVVAQLPKQIAVLKVAHHGSATASSEFFLKRISFQTALISVGEQNRYGHPAKEVMERLCQNSSFIYLTKDHGGITIDSDGVRYTITTMK